MMRTDGVSVTRLEDYRPSDFLIDTIDLDIRLHPTETRVMATSRLRPNPLGRPDAPLALDGDELVLVSVALDGAALAADAYTATPDGLTLTNPPRRPFTLSIETRIDPTANTKLMGLYRSNGVYCTQCEADGFRRITYALDRPDVMSVYTTRIEAERAEAPVLLGNGNPVEAGPVEGTSRHYALWFDPFPKPGYLFALVGGHLARTAKTYLTASGRPVEIAILVEPGKEDRAGYALDALERSMRWDERVFGREYDLDVFNVVAVSDFNMGAMENKGLNIFNEKYVLASPGSATDADYANIEAVIAHEYFHNWTGNRITCRDWFQLCLKEGLTVFRDQEFSSDERSRSVHRIAEVRTLRARQFTEDAGPLAHPVRPTAYREINNFYTATVYEKGAEIVRMLKTILGPVAFGRGMDRYFERNDGTAATVEDFLAAFSDVSGVDLTAFATWYAQAGTPTVSVETLWDEGARRYTLRFRQRTEPTPGQPDKAPLVIPIALGFVSPDGAPLTLHHPDIRPDGVFILADECAELAFEDVSGRPVPSVLRGFSAPVALTLDLSDGDLLALLRHDTDPFNRWQAAQSVAMRLLTGGPEVADNRALADFTEALRAFLDAEAERDPAFAALVLALPGEAEIAQRIGRDVDPDRIHATREAVRHGLGRRLQTLLLRIREALTPAGPYAPDAASAGRRAVRNAALDLIAAGDPDLGLSLCTEQLSGRPNMTDEIAAMAILSLIPSDAREAELRRFAARHGADPLVLDKWFAVQGSIPEPDCLDRVRGLLSHPGYSPTNPNRIRAVVGSFAFNNPTQFHRPDGAGYAFLVDQVEGLNAQNPQVAARLLTAFGTWRSLEPGRRTLVEAALRRLAGRSDLSPDVSDILQRSLVET